MNYLIFLILLLLNPSTLDQYYKNECAQKAIVKGYTGFGFLFFTGNQGYIILF